MNSDEGGAAAPVLLTGYGVCVTIFAPAAPYTGGA